jgi:hypothetical protein
MALAAALTPDKIKTLDREGWAKKWASLRGQLSRAQEVTASTVKNLAVSGTVVASFSLSYYARRRLQLKGKRVTFDAKGNIDAFFWPGLVAALVGSTPLLGEASPYLMASGVGAMCSGATSMIDKIAEEHHKGATTTAKNSNSKAA